MSSVLVTGGAGYIGSHTIQHLISRKHNVVVIDNLSTGFQEAIPPGAIFIRGDISDTALVSKIIKDYQVDSVVHFAASLIVSESVKDPLTYYINNVSGTLSLLQALQIHNVNRFIFSSTAAVYGETTDSTVIESSPTRPVSPYGRSKLMVEDLLRDISSATKLKFVALRYFNVAGAAVDGSNGQRTKGATHLIKVACEVALGKRDQIEVFGTDYPTLDGTGVRDYIHVEDLAAAHCLALEYLVNGGDSQILNCGYGHGYSVKQVIGAISKISSRDIPTKMCARRTGDAAQVVAHNDKIRKLLNWTPKYNSLELICKTSLDWEKRLNQSKNT